MKRLACLILFACSLAGAQTATTTVVGTVTNPSGTGLTGKVYITWSRFTAAGGEIIPAPTRPLEVTVTNGTFTVELIPNDTALPAGTGYTVWYSFYPGLTETWTVPTSGSDVNAADIATTDSVDATFTVALTQLTRGGATTNQCLIWNGYWQAQTCPGSGVWGSITGTLSTQTDLQNALNAKAATSHAHAGTDITSGTVPVARLPVVVGDSGSGGTAGIVPAPGTGDAAALKFLKADGTWATTPPGFANPLTTRGDIIVQGASGTIRLARGTSGYCLTNDGTDVVWAACPSGFADPMSARGDLIYRGASGTTRLPIGTNNYCLKSNGVDPVWGACSTFTNPMSALGEMIYGGSGGNPSVVVSNTTTTRKFLRSVGSGGGVAGAPTWDTLVAADLPNPAVGAKGGVEAKACSGDDRMSAIGTDGVPVCSTTGSAADPPYTATVSAQTSVNVAVGTHGQGTLALAQCFDDSTPRQAVSCTYTRASNGDFAFTFSPAFTGLIQIGAGGGGGGSGADASGYYLVSRSTNAPANAVNLGALTTGVLKVTVSGSVATPSVVSGSASNCVLVDGTSGACGSGTTYTAGPTGMVTIVDDEIDLDTAVVPRLAAANVWTGLQDFTTATNVLIKEGTPANASATCTKGTILFDSTHISVCIATNTWKRVAIATW